ncbi:inositol monophosphatase family protein [Bacteroidota bacterium]
MIENVYKIALEAGNIIRDGFGRQFSVEYKTNSSNLVTEIDKKAENAIINFITTEYSGHNIIAEESGEQQSDSEYTWVIDPLDGTTNFAHGLPIFSVSIGIQKKGQTIIGVIYDVMNNVMYSAEKGNGAYRDNQKINVGKNSSLEESLLVTGFPYNIKENPDDVIKKFNDFLLEARAVRRLGSAAIDFCYVASGVFDGFWEVHLSPWDVCAGALIVEEAGGKVTDFAGESVSIHSKQYLASNGRIHDEMMKVLNRSD